MYNNSIKKLLNQKVQTHKDGSKEHWRDVPGFNKKVRVSDLGRVKLIEYKVTYHYRDGEYRTRTIAGHIINPYQNKKGGMVFSIGGKLFKVHRIVLLAFVGPCPRGMECRHLNGKAWDNRLENLAWGTHLENCADRDRHGTTAWGERIGVSKLTNKQVFRIHSLYKTGKHTIQELAKRFNVKAFIISPIIRGKRASQFGLEALEPYYPHGQHPRSKSCQNKLTDAQALEIQHAYDAGKLTPRLKEQYAKRFNIHVETVRMIAVRKRYKHIS